MSDFSKRIASLSPDKINALMRQLGQQKGDSAETKITPLKREPDSFFPQSFAQQRLWILSHLDPDSKAYNIPLPLRLNGSLNVSALERSLGEIVRRHEALRTTFDVLEGQPVQRIAPPPTLSCPVNDLRHLPEAEREEEARRQVTEAAFQSFDLAHGPLFRASLWQLDEQEHLLLLTFHHIVTDAWSTGVFMRELSSLYEAFSKGAPSPLQELPVQYADFAQWQREWLHGDVVEKQLEYWKGKLRGAPPLLALPTDRARPPVQTFRGAKYTVAFSRSLSEPLKDLCNREGVTLFMVLLAGLQTLFRRYTGQEDFCLGASVANRRRPEIEGLIGFFVNTLVLRSDLGGDPSFSELLKRVRETTLAAFANQDVPFERLVEELQPERNLSYPPLFQCAFTLQNVRAEGINMEGLKISSFDIGFQTAKYDLTLSMEDTPKGLRGRLEYSTDLFDAETVERMVGHFETLLAGAAADPTRRLSELPLLSAKEEQQLLVTWNQTERPYPRDCTLHSLFERQAALTPDSIAVVSAGERVTYRELNERANRVAHYLRSLGVREESLVGVMMERSSGLVTALLGVLKAGGAYVPLDPAYPEARLAFMAEDAGLRVILTQGTLAGLMPAGEGLTMVSLDELSEELAAQSVENPQTAVGAQNLCYVIYTSGSTGTPKGAMNTHRALCNHMFWMQRATPLDGSDCVLQKTPFSFDASVWEIYVPLLAGARLVMAQPGGHKDAQYLVETMKEQSVTVLQAVPSLLRMLVEEPKLNECQSLRHMFCGGEALPHELVERFEQIHGTQLYNLYGPTEAAIEISMHRRERGKQCGPTVPIGRPIDNTKLYVLDAAMRPVPVGVAGELYIGGEALGRGYLGRPALTAERFVPDPFAAEGGARLYRTGDSVRHLAGGELEFLGRLDYQVKLRGFRIELGEIESALVAHLGVHQAVVLLKGEGDSAQLVAYVVADRGDDASGEAQAAAPTEAELRQYALTLLPDHMVPRRVVLLEALPQTPNGKLDRSQLPEPGRAEAAETAGGFVAPRGAVEAEIAAVWAEVLGVERVGLWDNFFDLGGHSLLLVAAHARLRERYGQRLTMMDMFRYPSVGELAQFLGGEDEGEGEGTGEAGATRAKSAGAAGRESAGGWAGGREAVAVIGMAGRFPGAHGVQQLWENLRGGVESISFYADEELRALGADEALLRDPEYVKAGGHLEGVGLFDASFFGLTPREAEVMDPQHRLLLEAAWEALEEAGYDTLRYSGRIGLFAGVGNNNYIFNLHSHPEIIKSVGRFQIKLGNAHDFLATQISYKLNLRGPSVVVQTACSTSLVAVHLACQSLLSGESDIALAGGVSLLALNKAGYFYQQDGITSPDGHCRAFDASAQGTVGGSGLGLVVLKRLAEALRDGDHLHAVIRGSAINNDGSGKVGYTAPSIGGQAAVITEALRAAGLSPRDISYVEAHGTATPLGDPVEVAALRQAFAAMDDSIAAADSISDNDSAAADTSAERVEAEGGGAAHAETSEADGAAWCGLGSVKSNVGHLDAAAGVTGLIKTVLSLRHRELPPTLHFERANPALGLDGSPFYVNDRLRAWDAGAGGDGAGGDGADRNRVRRAGVSSFGIGGTNAHVVVEEAEENEAGGESVRGWQLLLVSGRSEWAAEESARRLAAHLGAMADEGGEVVNDVEAVVAASAEADAPGARSRLADAAYTLATGRRQFTHRRVVACRTAREGMEALLAPHSPLVLKSVSDGSKRSIAFMFPGLGEHYVGMASELYEQEPTFRAEVDHCAEALREHLGLDLREVLYPGRRPDGDVGGEKTAHTSDNGRGLDLRKMLKRDAGQGDESARKLNQTFLTQPIVFVIEYALSRLWMEWGIKPQAMIGYSIGEYVAACLAGVMSLEDALALVAKRARLIQALPAGAMLAVPLPEDEVSTLLGERLSLAAVNGPSLCVVAGPPEAVADLKARLAAREVICSDLQTSHAFHSRMMRPIADSFIELVRTVRLSAPRIPYISNVTGTWITAEQATDPEYYARHLCQAVRFADGLEELWRGPTSRIFLEVGPGQTLGSLALQHPAGRGAAERVVVPTLPSAYDRQPAAAFLLNSLGMLWLGGAEVDWAGFYAHERRQRVTLPTYPFERQLYFIERQGPSQTALQAHTKLSKRPDAADWFYLPSWKRSTRRGVMEDGRRAEPSRRLLMFADECGVGARLSEYLGRGREVLTVTPGAEYARLGEHSYVINPREPADYSRLLKELADSNKAPDGILHLWSVTREKPAPDCPASEDIERFEAAQERGFYSLLHLTQALGTQNFVEPLHLTVLTNNAQEVTGEETLAPEKATLFGLCKVVTQEYANITCRAIDVVLPEAGGPPPPELIAQLASDLDAERSNEMLAYRGRHRWEQTFVPARLDEATKLESPLRQGGVYLIVGGLGQIGRALAEYLARSVKAKLVLTGRTRLPAREDWEGWLQTHDEADGVSARIASLKNLEALGAEVLALNADVADERQMQEVIAQTRARFGALDGVVYLAGTTGIRAFRALPETGPAECAWHFQSKAHGLYVLEKVLRGQGVDFCFLFSSLSSVLGGLGFAAYASANAFMDIFTHEHNRKEGAAWRCADWDTWLVKERSESPQDAQSNLSALVMNAEEGAEAFLRILSARDVSRVVVSLADLDTRIEQWIKHEPEGGAGPAEEAAVSLHRRPTLRNDYVAPRNEVEESLADIWQQVLGIEQVGVYDNFFQLGGHSLLGTQVISRVRKTFMIDMSVRAIFDAHTVAALAEAIIQKRAQQFDGETLDRLLAELKQ